MKLITNNDQLYSLLPNIMTVVKGERSVIDKIVPFIDETEKTETDRGKSNKLELCRVMTKSYVMIGIPLRLQNCTSLQFLRIKKRIKGFGFE